MKNDEFTHYYGSHARHKRVVAQSSVAQKYPLVRSRVPADLKTKITKRAIELKSNESKLTRILWEDYFKKLDEKKMRVEMEGL
jgi:ABC-type phosphate/phosphonate transport system substrate-binding protein